MAQNISLWGANYSAVPGILLPKTGSGQALFTDVSDTTAQAADVAAGKYFYTSAGERTQGTNSGGGGSGLTLLATKALGAISTASTSAVDTGQTVSVSGINAYDALIIETTVDTRVNGRHAGTVAFVFLNGSSNVSTKNGSNIATVKQNYKLSSSGTLSSRGNTTAYGVYPNAVTISNGTATVTMYERYNSTQTGTINGSYTTRVYGLKLNELIGG